MIPKVGTAADVYALDMLVTQIERAKGMQEAHRLRADHRDGAGHAEHRGDRRRQPAQRIAAFRRRRLRGFDARAHHHIGGANPDYAVLTDPGPDGKRETHWGDMWHYALSRLVVAARAYGIRPLDGPFGNFSRRGWLSRRRQACRRAGVRGQMGDPPQPGGARQRCLQPERRRGRPGAPHHRRHGGRRARRQGAASLDGKLIDYASIRQAENLVRKADLVAASAT